MRPAEGVASLALLPMSRFSLSAQTECQTDGNPSVTPTLQMVNPASLYRRMTRLRISVMSSMAKRMPSRPRPEFFTPP